MGSNRDGEIRVSAVMASFNRCQALARVLDELAGVAEVGEIVVADNGSTDGTLEMLALRPDVVVLPLNANLGVAARNRAAEAARGQYLLLLDDDSFPRPGAVTTLVELLDADPTVAIAGGFVEDIDGTGTVLRDREPGTFDWLLRGGRAVPPGGLPSYFFPECAAVARREHFLAVGGYFEPYFHSGTLGLDVTTSLLSHGWDVRYLPTAVFAHLKDAVRPAQADMTRLRVRNEMWYFTRFFPARMAVPRMTFYAGFNLVLAAYLGHPKAVLAGLRDAWRGRRAIRATRHVLPRTTARRAELNRTRLHVRLLYFQLRRRLQRDNSSTLRRTTGQEFLLAATIKPVPTPPPSDTEPVVVAAGQAV